MSIVRFLFRTGKRYKEITDTDTPRLGQAGTRRLVATGSNITIGGTSTLTLFTGTRNAGELLIPCYFLTNNTNGDSFGEGSATTVTFYFERTANAGEFRFKASNAALLTSKTFDWAIEGIVP